MLVSASIGSCQDRTFCRWQVLDNARHLGLGFAPTPTWGESEPALCSICSCMSFSGLHEWFLDNGGELAPGIGPAKS